ncbi:hypothetical protein L1987_37351 [Smallanthus sonchifolius]|uniref:Uncharacterized protein n=1 Tax=Smallanthus sonchifolius TaxID=185202 RepID=A0ACB9HHD8_9ASTR|nr:hypothetical protein L1987_37351 [Smallanthus sonchifolius]
MRRCWRVDLKLMKDFFIEAVENEAVIQRGGRVEGNKPNMPQKIFVAYVLLIIFYRFILVQMSPSSRMEPLITPVEVRLFKIYPHLYLLT